ncbi:fluoride efflux transporter FluC [Fructilactobacillus carniphilus]|uniref:Fluoride-specific ion channel FluC n=1 Tax=Fructilactobacillus carniphilus TaxID=2940297 RepID=A0ABY5C035_9LACO|nr:CrcB family protein [Fructilactobacillus carniphilus]USS91213.1 CrcB family protein [Fructilactobacillus carniphilus]
MEPLLVLIGGIVGGGLRISLTDLLPDLVFPYATLLINLGGAFLLPLWNNYWAFKFHCRPAVRKAVGVGGIGSFTTFSGITLDVGHLLLNQHYAGLAIYLLITIIGGVICAILGDQYSNSLRESEAI